jgi:sarcosine oxidase subunit beta
VIYVGECFGSLRLRQGRRRASGIQARILHATWLGGRDRRSGGTLLSPIPPIRFLFMARHITETAIIGAGVVGCSIALELARRGVQVTVIDRNGDVGHGSTSASCGIVRRFYSAAPMTAMAHEASFIWQDWAEYLGAAPGDQLARFERPGMLVIPPAIDEGIERVVEHMRAIGIVVDILSAEQVSERFPFLDTRSKAPIRRPEDDDFFDDSAGPIAGAVFEEGAGYVVSPTLATVNLRVACEAAGVRFLLGEQVVAIEEGSSEQRFECRLASAHTISSDVLVNVAGPHSCVINEMAGVELPIEVKPLRKEIAVVPNPTAAMRPGGGMPVLGDLDSGVYCRPEGGGKDLVVGSLEPACDELPWVEDPDSNSVDASRESFECYSMRMMKRVPSMELGRFRGLASMYDVTTLDWHPVLDRTDRDGYYVAIGTSGSSFKTAPVIGLLMSELIRACESGVDTDAHPLSLRLPRTGIDLDTSFVSRLRSAQESSNTVLG